MTLNVGDEVKQKINPHTLKTDTPDNPPTQTSFITATQTPTFSL